MNNKSVFGLNENLAAALAYVGIFISGIVVLVMERENKFVRFAAMQSTIFFGALAIVMWVLGLLAIIPVLGWILGWLFGLVGWLLGVAGFIVWLYLMITAYKGQAVKLPVLGDICWDQVHK